MTELRPLRGGCQCGRNRYIIAVPQTSIDEALVHFNTEPIHQIPLATPLAAFIRVPLSWYHSTTYAFYPDETHTMIRRVYTHPNQEYSKRHFCGFCGTPLSYWSEEPQSEANFINLTLGSLLREDLRDLEDMGLIPDDSEQDESEGPTEKPQSPAAAGSSVLRSTALRESYGVPWFDGLVEGTRLGKLRRSQGIKQSQDGKVRIEWEIVEYNDSGNEAAGDYEDVDMGSAVPGKRKLGDLDNTDHPVVPR